MAWLVQRRSWALQRSLLGAQLGGGFAVLPMLRSISDLSLGWPPLTLPNPFVWDACGPTPARGFPARLGLVGIASGT